MLVSVALPSNRAQISANVKRARGEKVSPSMIWRFFDRHDIAYKKSRHECANYFEACGYDPDELLTLDTS